MANNNEQLEKIDRAEHIPLTGNTVEQLLLNINAENTVRVPPINKMNTPGTQTLPKQQTSLSHNQIHTAYNNFNQHAFKDVLINYINNNSYNATTTTTYEDNMRNFNLIISSSLAYFCIYIKDKQFFSTIKDILADLINLCNLNGPEYNDDYAGLILMITRFIPLYTKYNYTNDTYDYGIKNIELDEIKDSIDIILLNHKVIYKGYNFLNAIKEKLTTKKHNTNQIDRIIKIYNDFYYKYVNKEMEMYLESYILTTLYNIHNPPLNITIDEKKQNIKTFLEDRTLIKKYLIIFEKLCNDNHYQGIYLIIDCIIKMIIAYIPYADTNVLKDFTYKRFKKDITKKIEKIKELFKILTKEFNNLSNYFISFHKTRNESVPNTQQNIQGDYNKNK